jgi:type II secretory ATPase GspE/PulE/Tfp pilus assembly ATPase PilB-like protein
MLRQGRQPVADLVWRATGCRECGMTGYLGRLGIFEVWPLTEPHCELIIEETNELALRRRLRKDGVPSLFDDMFAKAAEGLTSLDEMQAIGGFALYAAPVP